MGVPTYYFACLAVTSDELTSELARNMRLFIFRLSANDVGNLQRLETTYWPPDCGALWNVETVMITSNPCRPQDGKRMGGTVGKVLPGVELRVQGMMENL